MLIKLNENGNVRTCLYESSNILGSTYDKSTKELVITFKRGTQYKYYDVSNVDYTRFEVSDSQGVVLNSHIKKYKTETIDTVDPNKFIDEINNVKLDELKSFESLLSKTCGFIVDEFNVNNELSLKTINTLQEVLNKVIELKK